MKKPILEVYAVIVILLAVGCIAFEFLGGADWLINKAEAATTETTVTVVVFDEVSSASVTASVPCNEVNCKEEVEQSWWEEVKSWFADLGVF